MQALQSTRAQASASTRVRNAGLLHEHREAVEEGFRSGAISVLVATSTVATGVNLPAQRVVIRDHFIGIPRNVLDATRFRQMCGRAGRAGIDSRGEAVIMLTSKAPGTRRHIELLLTAEVRPSSLTSWFKSSTLTRSSAYAAAVPRLKSKCFDQTCA